MGSTWSPEGFDRIARVWEFAAGTEIVRLDPHTSLASVAFSLDRKYVVSGGYDLMAHVWEVATGKAVTRMTHDDVVSSVAFSPNGKYVVTGSYDNTARVWI